MQEKWYFCINDVIAALTDSKDPAEYFKKIRRRDSELDDFVRGTNCPPPTNSLLRMAKGILQNVCDFSGFRLTVVDDLSL